MVITLLLVIVVVFQILNRVFTHSREKERETDKHEKKIEAYLKDRMFSVIWQTVNIDKTYLLCLTTNVGRHLLKCLKKNDDVWYIFVRLIF